MKDVTLSTNTTSKRMESLTGGFQRIKYTKRKCQIFSIIFWDSSYLFNWSSVCSNYSLYEQFSGIISCNSPHTRKNLKIALIIQCTSIYLKIFVLNIFQNNNNSERSEQYQTIKWQRKTIFKLILENTNYIQYTNIGITWLMW